MDFETIDVDFTKISNSSKEFLWSKKLQPSFEVLETFSEPVTCNIDFYRHEFFNACNYGIEHHKYIIGGTNGVVEGIIPLEFVAGLPTHEYWNFAGSAIHCNFIPPCPPLLLKQFLPHLPAVSDCFIDPTFLKSSGINFSEIDGGEFELCFSSLEEYISNIPFSGKRNNLRRNLRQNNHLEIKFGLTKILEDLPKILNEYNTYWDSRAEESAIDVPKRMRHTLNTFCMFESKVLAFGLYDNNELVAANFAWLDPINKVVIDMLCVRTMQERYKSRGLGIYAVLKNIEKSIQLGYKKYTMTAGDQQYKKQFEIYPIKSGVFSTASLIDVMFKKRDAYYKGIWMGDDKNLIKILQSISDQSFLDMLEEIKNLPVFFDLPEFEDWKKHKYDLDMC